MRHISFECYIIGTEIVNNIDVYDHILEMSEIVHRSIKRMDLMQLWATIQW